MNNERGRTKCQNRAEKCAGTHLNLIRQTSLSLNNLFTDYIAVCFIQTTLVAKELFPALIRVFVEPFNRVADSFATIDSWLKEDAWLVIVELGVIAVTLM